MSDSLRRSATHGIASASLFRTCFHRYNIIVYTVKRHPVYAPLVTSLWEASSAGTVQVATSEQALMEALIVPLRTGDTALMNDYERALLNSDIHLVPLSQPVLREAARLRATIPALRTPDALHGASALLGACALFVTNDAGFRRIPGLPIAVLDDLASP